MKWVGGWKYSYYTMQEQFIKLELCKFERVQHKMLTNSHMIDSIWNNRNTNKFFNINTEF